MDGEGKRKFPVDKKLFIFCNSLGGPNCVVLYELKITITTCGAKIMVEPRFPSENDKLLMPVEFFYTQRIIPIIESVAACVWGSTLYVMPHDEEKVYGSDRIKDVPEGLRKLVLAERDTLAPYTLDLLENNKKKREMPVFPSARKTMPLMIATGKHIFALSGILRRLQTPQPCFESLDPDTFTWTQLDTPPFHNDQYFIIGFVVLEEDGFILVSLDHAIPPKPEVKDDIGSFSVQYYSYNIRSGLWLPAHLPEPSSLELNPHYTVNHYIHKEAAVLGNDIYTFFPSCKVLLVFPYHVVAKSDYCDTTISLGQQAVVQGLEFNESPDIYKDLDSCFERTGTVAKIDEGILCVLHTLRYNELEYQDFCVTFVQPLPPGPKCITLKSFTCTFSRGNVIEINSCFVMNDLDEKRDHRRVKRENDTDDNALIGMESSGTGEVEAM